MKKSQIRSLPQLQKEVEDIKYDVTQLQNGGGIAYLSYTGFLTQSSTSAPTITILEDTITGIVITRTGVGTYTFTKSGAFTLNKTVPVDDVYTDQQGNLYKITKTNTSVLTLTTYSYTNTTLPADNVLNNRYINIQVYN